MTSECRIILDLEDLRSELNSHIQTRLTDLIIDYIAHRIDDYTFLSEAKLNALLYGRKAIITRKCQEFAMLLEAISHLQEDTYALIKVKPFILNIWNDIDLLVRREEVHNILSVLKKNLPIREILKGLKGLTIFLDNITLRIDLYYYIGWRGLEYINASILEAREAARVSLPNGDHVEISTINTDIDLVIQLLHIYNNGYLHLSDLLKFLCVGGFKDLKEWSLNNFVKHTIRSFNKVVQNCKTIKQLFLCGKVKMPMSYETFFSLQVMFKNLHKRNINFKAYYEELRHRSFNFLHSM